MMTRRGEHLYHTLIGLAMCVSLFRESVDAGYGAWAQVAVVALGVLFARARWKDWERLTRSGGTS